MKLFLDFLPVFLFFISYNLADIYVATAVAITATTLVLFYTWFNGKLHLVQWINFSLIATLGCTAIWLHDETLIKCKTTVIYWLLAISFLLSNRIRKKNLVKVMLSHYIRLPNILWQRLNVIWIIFFSMVGLINLLVAYYFDTDTWVSFKLFGGLGFTALLLLAHGIYISRYLSHQKN